MARKNNKYIRIGKNFSRPRSIFETIKLLEEAEIETVEHYALVTTGFIARDIKSMIEQLNRRSTNRGRGARAADYNQPMKDAKINVTGGYGRYYIEVLPADSPFNILDAGAPERPTADGKPMRFPVYRGQLTKSKKQPTIRDDDKSVPIISGRVNVDPKPRFITVKKVAKIDPRYFFKRAADRWRLFARKNPRQVWKTVEDPDADDIFKEFGLNMKSEAVFRFRFDPKLISVRQIKRSRG